MIGALGFLSFVSATSPPPLSVPFLLPIPFPSHGFAAGARLIASMSTVVAAETDVATVLSATAAGEREADLDEDVDDDEDDEDAKLSRSGEWERRR